MPTSPTTRLHPCLFLLPLLAGCGPAVIGAAIGSAGGGGGGGVAELRAVETTITAGPAENSFVATANVTIEFSSPDATRFEFRTAATEPFQAATARSVQLSLADGPVAFEVRGARDRGTFGPPARRNFTVDTVAPTAVTITNRYRTAVGAVTLEWNASGDNNGGSGLEHWIVRYGSSPDALDQSRTVAPGVVGLVTAEMVNLPQCTGMFARVDAVDRAGNISSSATVPFHTGCGADGRFVQLATIALAPATPLCIAIGDHDGDGQSDAYVGGATAAGGVVRVLRNQGDLGGRGLLPFGPQILRGAPVRAVVATDMDRDGVEDLVIAFGNTLEVLLGDGDRTTGNSSASYAQLSTKTFGQTILGVQLADLDRNAVPDFVVLFDTGSDRRIAAVKGNDDGTLGSSLTNLSLGTGDDFVVLRANRDRFSDVVVTSPADGTRLLLGSATGLLAPTSIGPGGDRVVALDADGDAVMDVAVASSGATSSVRLLRNGGSTFTDRGEVTVPAPIVGLLVADFDADRLPDVMAASADRATLLTTVLEAAGPSLVAAAEPLPGGSQSTGLGAGVVADIDLDGMPDFVLVDGDLPGVRTFTGTGVIGSGDGGFGAPTPLDVGTARPFSAVTADLDGDRVTDVGLTSTAQNPEFLRFGNRGSRGQGDGELSITGTSATSSRPQGIANGDLNGDGTDDVVVVNFLPQGLTGSIDVFLSRPDGTVTASDLQVAESPRNVVIFDFDDDTRPDLAIAHFNPPRLTLVRNNGNPNAPFAQADVVVRNPTGAAGGFFALAAADVDGDGDQDLVVTDVNRGTFAVVTNTDRTASGFDLPSGSTWIPTSLSITTPAERRPSYVHVADFTGDGALDVLISNGQQLDDNPATARLATISVHPGLVDANGRVTGLFAPGGTETVVSGTGDDPVDRPWQLAVADLDRDRVLDVVAVSVDFADANLAVLLGSGSNGRGDGQFAPPVFHGLTGVGKRFDVALADLDGDAILDIVVAGEVGPPSGAVGSAEVLFGTGTRIVRQ